MGLGNLTGLDNCCKTQAAHLLKKSGLDDDEEIPNSYVLTKPFVQHMVYRDQNDEAEYKIRAMPGLDGCKSIHPTLKGHTNIMGVIVDMLQEYNYTEWNEKPGAEGAGNMIGASFDWRLLPTQVRVLCCTNDVLTQHICVLATARKKRSIFHESDGPDRSHGGCRPAQNTCR